MTDWTPTVDTLESTGSGSIATQPMPRTARRSALRPAASRRELYADAREQARLVRGRDMFVWRGRVLPIGLPLAAAAGAFVWRRNRSVRETVMAMAGVGLASYFEARVEWSVRRRAHRRRRA